MDLVLVLILSLGLSMDSFAVSLANGFKVKKQKIISSVKVCLSFAFFQSTMTLGGLLIGTSLQSVFSEVDHWIAFVLLSFLGIKMIIESTRPTEGERSLSNKVIISQSLATSVDALIAGISIAFLKIQIITTIFIIGITTFLMSYMGITLGKKMGNILKEKAEFFGGLILIGIGLKILISHLL